MASEITQRLKSRLNPLRCGSTSLPLTLNLGIKLIALGLLLKHYHLLQITQPFLPFIRLFDLVSFPFFKEVLQVLYAGSCVLILFNRRVRLCSLVLALSILCAMLSSRLYYSNNITFCACVAFLVSLHDKQDEPWLIRWQLMLVYLGAGINKLFEVDWRSGQYFDHWMKSILDKKYYIWLDSRLPAMMLGKLFGWSTILTELGLFIGFAIKRFKYIAIWVAIYFHAGAMLVSGQDYNIFTTALFASYAMVIDWPERVHIFVNAERKGLTAFVRMYQRLECDGIFAVRAVPFNARAAHRLFYVEIGGRVFSGLLGFKRLVYYTPLFYFGIVLVLCLSPAQYVWWRSKAIEVLLVLFCPVYDVWCEYRQSRKKSNG